MKSPQTKTSKVVPFTGEFYPQGEQTPAVSSNAPYFFMMAAALIAGLSIGAISTYQSTDQVQLRQMKAQSEQLQQVKTQVCK